MVELVNNTNTTTGTTNWGTSGTLGSRGLYQGVSPPRNSQAQGIYGTDNRAYTRNVTGNELVQNRMQGLMNRGGAYMQNAAQRGMETANRRGLLNSSIAAGSAERSSLEAAMPIAQADAATYGRTQSENMGALNQGLMQERDIMNQQTMEGLRAASSGQNAQLQAMLAREGMQLELQRQRENLAFSGEQQGLDRFQQQQMAQFGFGADLARNQQQYGFQRGLNEQGFGFDVGRMGAQDYYNSQEGQRDVLNQLTMAEYGMGLQAMGNFYNRMGDEFWDNPGTMNDPYVQQAIMNFGQSFRPNFMSLFNSIYGGG
jgi:hypothetical protein